MSVLKVAVLSLLLTSTSACITTVNPSSPTKELPETTSGLILKLDLRTVDSSIMASGCIVRFANGTASYVARLTPRSGTVAIALPPGVYQLAGYRCAAHHDYLLGSTVPFRIQKDKLMLAGSLTIELAEDGRGSRFWFSPLDSRDNETLQTELGGRLVRPAAE